MKHFGLFFLFISLIFNIHCRTLDKLLPIGQHSDENFNIYSVVPKKILKIWSSDDDSQHEIKLGQVGGLAANVQNANLLTVFHRGSRQWNENSFPDGRHFDTNNFGPIPENTILLLDTRTGQIIHEWGNETFFMPHGLSSDTEGNLWLTDVAMHQVFKYSHGKLILTLGQLFVPGNDEKHFCKPTDVAVTNDGSNIFVADGYCNSRLIKFDSNGKYLRQYSMKSGQNQLLIPHSLVLIETLQLICVADRQNGRIVCFDIGLDDENDEGEVKEIITHSLMKTVYALTFDQHQNRLYAVSGGAGNDVALGFTFSVHPQSFGQFISTWKPNQNFGEPHDLALSVNGRTLFVGEIRPNRIDSFDVIN